MRMREESRQAFIDLLTRQRREIIEAGTDWVVAQAIDLRGARPREETRALVERVVAFHEALLVDGDDGPLSDFVESVTSLRASSEFHVSTLLKGFLSFRKALEKVLRREPLDTAVSLDVLAAVDDAYFTAIFHVSDVYVDKLNLTIIERRRALEAELAEVIEKKSAELADKITTIEAQREALANLSSPVIRLFRGVVVMPIVGEVSPDRAARITQRVLDTVSSERVSHVILDITGLTSADTHAAFALSQALGAARLLGAEGAIVGVSPAVARTFVLLGIGLDGTPTFATLEDGLRAALQNSGYAIVRARRM